MHWRRVDTFWGFASWIRIQIFPQIPNSCWNLEYLKNNFFIADIIIIGHTSRWGLMVPFSGTVYAVNHSGTLHIESQACVSFSLPSPLSRYTSLCTPTFLSYFVPTSSSNLPGRGSLRFSIPLLFLSSRPLLVTLHAQTILFSSRLNSLLCPARPLSLLFPGFSVVLSVLVFSEVVLQILYLFFK